MQSLDDPKACCELCGLQQLALHLLSGGVRGEVKDVVAGVRHWELLAVGATIHTLDHHTHLLKAVDGDAISACEED